MPRKSPELTGERGAMLGDFTDRVSQHIAKRLPELRASEISRDMSNAARGIPRDEAQAERWRKLGLLSGTGER